jgi:tRNA dimethylallyltransferase
MAASDAAADTPADESEDAREARRWAAATAHLAAAGDGATAARLARNDFYRLERALEIVRATGQPLSAFAAEGPGASPFDFRCGSESSAFP